jgi:hypothetical protein
MWMTTQDQALGLRPDSSFRIGRARSAKISSILAPPRPDRPSARERHVEIAGLVDDLGCGLKRLLSVDANHGATSK